jgi:hypothetical protein
VTNVNSSSARNATHEKANFTAPKISTGIMRILEEVFERKVPKDLR